MRSINQKTEEIDQLVLKNHKERIRKIINDREHDNLAVVAPEHFGFDFFILRGDRTVGAALVHCQEGKGLTAVAAKVNLTKLYRATHFVGMFGGGKIIDGKVKPLKLWVFSCFDDCTLVYLFSSLDTPFVTEIDLVTGEGKGWISIEKFRPIKDKALT